MLEGEIPVDALGKTNSLNPRANKELEPDESAPQPSHLAGRLDGCQLTPQHEQGGGADETV